MDSDFLGAESRRAWRLPLPRGRAWALGPRPSVLAILNVTPDSFSDGGLHADADRAIEAALRFVEEGADAIDIGGESTRPGAADISTEEQVRRVVPVVEGIRRQCDVPISIDTRDPGVGEAALAAGADIVNDVSGLEDPAWAPVLAPRADVPVIVMHMRGTPRDMQERTDYPEGVVSEIGRYFERRLGELERDGIDPARVVLDPGIGFAKTARQNLEVLRGLGKLAALGRPILVGLSRKLFLGELLARGADPRSRDPRERDIGTVAANAFALLGGASALRVHNVAYTRDLADVFEGLTADDSAAGDRGAVE